MHFNNQHLYHNSANTDRQAQKISGQASALTSFYQNRNGNPVRWDHYIKRTAHRKWISQLNSVERPPNWKQNTERKELPWMLNLCGRLLFHGGIWCLWRCQKPILFVGTMAIQHPLPIILPGSPHWWTINIEVTESKRDLNLKVFNVSYCYI